MVCRLGPRPHRVSSAPDGVTRAGALARRRRRRNAGVEVRLLASNNEVLATAKTDAQGAARFDPGLSRGEGGLAPGLIVANDGQADANFLDLHQSAFDLTDRGVKGRVAPTRLDAFVYAERGVYRSGETVFLTALLRDAQGAAIAQTAADPGRQAPRRRRVPEDDNHGPGAWRAQPVVQTSRQRQFRQLDEWRPLSIPKARRWAKPRSWSRTTFPSAST